MNPSRRELLRWSTLASLSHVLGPSALYGASTGSGDSSAPSIFLRDNFAPVTEEITAHDLPVEGTLPRDLVGMYVRNGPNPMFPPRGKYHWFDGDGMLHGVEIDGDASSKKAVYRNRFIQTAGLAEERKQQKAIYGGLLDPPTPADVLRGPNHIFKNAANTALVWHQQKLLALWEAGLPHGINVPSLETRGIETFNGQLHQPFTAHPKIDPQTGEMRFFGYGVFGSQVAYGIVDARGEIVHRALIHGRYPAMMHDFAITENYSVFFELPCALQLAPGKPLFAYEPERGGRIGIIPTRGTNDDMRWFTIDPCFVFHTLNAYEQDNVVHVFACRAHEFPPIVGPLGADPKATWSPENLGSPKLVRWTLDLATGEARMATIDDFLCDFPRVDDRRLGQPNRFGYSMGVDFRSVAKFDFQKQTRSIHDLGPKRLGGEAIFVPRPESEDEDDGWLLSYVFDTDRQKSELLVLNAREMEGPPLARVLLPVRVPFGFHGAWIPQTEYRPSAT